MSTEHTINVEYERLLPDLADAVHRNNASFGQLCSAWINRRDDSAPVRQVFEYFYPKVLRAFQASHGALTDFFPLPQINAYVGRTDGVGDRRERAPDAAVSVPNRTRKPDMHLLYDLSKASFGGELLCRIEMMAADASRLLSGQKLDDCLDQLYSTTTDLLGLLLATHLAAAQRRGAASPPIDKLGIIEHDLRVIQQKYLITSARLTYFLGALAGTAGAILLAGAALGVQAIAHALGSSFDPGPAFYLAWLFGTAGAMLSVVQRLSSGRLDLRYDVGNGYTLLLGFLRPWIGAFGGLLIWVLVQGGVILNPQISAFYLAALAFAFGVAERTLGDVATQSGVLTSLAPSTPRVSEQSPSQALRSGPPHAPGVTRRRSARRSQKSGRA